MIRNIGPATLAAMAFAAVGVAAQTPPPAQSPPQTTPVGQITIVGCVEAAPPAAAGTTAAMNKYQLTNARKTGSGAQDAAGTSGTTGTSGRGQTYRLSGSDSKLAAEVGHVVEIVAVEEDVPMAEPGAATGTSGAMKPIPVVRVREVKMVAPKCPMP